MLNDITIIEITIMVKKSSMRRNELWPMVKRQACTKYDQGMTEPQACAIQELGPRFCIVIQKGLDLARNVRLRF